MYDALQVAKYIINKCIDLNRPISNLQLQKILYYVQGEYMKEMNGERLFNNYISAWQYGPVVEEVYYAYKVYSANEITDYQDKENLSPKAADIIDPVIEEKSKLSAWSLVEKTHSEDPWKNAIKNEGIITKEEMQDFFCNNKNQ